MTPTTPTIIFVLGGPGAGKGTQCSRLAQQHPHIHHISVGDVLRAESRNPTSEFAPIIAENMRNGTIGPKEITVEILRRAIKAAVRSSEPNRPVVILLDGFPRAKNQLALFETVIQRASFGIFLECGESIRLERLLHRAAIAATATATATAASASASAASERQDDDAATIQKRFRTFAVSTMAVVWYLENESESENEDQHENRLARINAEGSVEETFAAVEGVLRGWGLL